MEEILKCDSIEQYNDLHGLETRHPLVAIVDFEKGHKALTYRMTLGFYCLFLKETKGCSIDYGRSHYDFDDQTIVSFAPGQTIGVTAVAGTLPKGTGLLFHPDFIRGTQLGRKIRQYSFFSYQSNEALHLSPDERNIVTECFNILRTELNHSIDRHTRNLMCTNIELLLDYCMRFYERQFITRQNMNIDTLARFESLIDDYLFSGEAERSGIPSVQYFADKICLSANYFGDLVKKETGKSAKEYIQLKMLRLAKEELADHNKSVSQVAYQLGFQYPQHFNRFFKKLTGLSPRSYRLQQN